VVFDIGDHVLGVVGLIVDHHGAQIAPPDAHTSGDRHPKTVLVKQRSQLCLLPLPGPTAPAAQAKVVPVHFVNAQKTLDWVHTDRGSEARSVSCRSLNCAVLQLLKKVASADRRIAKELTTFNVRPIFWSERQICDSHLYMPVTLCSLLASSSRNSVGSRSRRSTKMRRSLSFKPELGLSKWR
jgi:hypothetical protein